MCPQHGDFACAEGHSWSLAQANRITPYDGSQPDHANFVALEGLRCRWCRRHHAPGMPTVYIMQPMASLLALCWPRRELGLGVLRLRTLGMALPAVLTAFSSASSCTLALNDVLSQDPAPRPEIKCRTPGMALPVVLMAGALTEGLFSVGLATACTGAGGALTPAMLWAITLLTLTSVV